MLEGLPTRRVQPDRAAGRRLLHLCRRQRDDRRQPRALRRGSCARRGWRSPPASTSTRGAARGTLRFSYAGATADIAEGLRRLEAWAPAPAPAAGAASVRTADRARPPAAPLRALGSGALRLPSGFLRSGLGLRAAGRPPASGPSRRHGAGTALDRRSRSVTSASTAVTGLRTRSRVARRCGASASGTSTISGDRLLAEVDHLAEAARPAPRLGAAGSAARLLGRRVAGAAAARATPRLRPRLRLASATSSAAGSSVVGSSAAARRRPRLRLGVCLDRRAAPVLAGLAAAAPAAPLALAAAAARPTRRPRRSSPPPPRRRPPPPRSPPRGRRPSAGSGSPAPG